MRSRAGTSSSHLSDAVQSVIHRIGGLHTLGSANKRGSAFLNIDAAPPSSSSSQNIFGSNIFINEKSFVTNRFDVAQGALRSLLGTPFDSLFMGEAREQRNADDAFRHLKALRRAFSDRTELAMHITVPRDFINEFEGFVPFFLEQCRFHKSQMETARIAFSPSAAGDGGAPSGPLDDENVNVERLLDWFELFYPEKDYSVLPFPQLLAALDGFFAYQKGGIDTGVPLGHFRPYFGVEIPATSEEYKLYRVLYHWLEEFGVKSGTFQTALDAGARSGYLSALLVKANMNTVVAVDDNDFALQCLQDNLKRLNRRKMIKRRAVFTQKSGDLLPKGSPSSRGHSTKGVEEGLLANPFLEAAKRRRLMGRSPLMNVAGSADEPLETHGLLEDAGITDISSLGRAFDLITFHRPVPNLFDHPLYSAASRNSAHSSVDSQLDRVLTLLESSPDHSGLLNPDKGHIAIISSNYHELLQYSSHTSSSSSSSAKVRLEETLAHTIHSRSERQYAKTRVTPSAAASSTKRIVGWDIVKRETRPLAALGEQYFGGGGIGGIFKSILSDKSEGYAAYAESKRFYDKLQHEMVVIKPRYTTLFGSFGCTAGKKGTSAVAPSSRHKPSRDAVDPFSTNDLIDWEDTYEYNHYLPKDGTGNPFHLTAAIDSYSYLSDDYYGEGNASALEIGSGSARFYNSSDPADVLGRVPRPNMASVDEARARKSASEARRAMRYNKEGDASAADAFVRSSTFAVNKSEDVEDGTSLAKRVDINRKTGTTPMFDLLFNREMRLGRRKKWRKLGFDTNERQRYYLDKKVVESQAAKLQVLNEIDRFDFRDPSKY